MSDMQIICIWHSTLPEAVSFVNERMLASNVVQFIPEGSSPGCWVALRLDASQAGVLRALIRPNRVIP